MSQKSGFLRQQTRARARRHFSTRATKQNHQHQLQHHLLLPVGNQMYVLTPAPSLCSFFRPRCLPCALLALCSFDFLSSSRLRLWAGSGRPKMSLPFPSSLCIGRILLVSTPVLCVYLRIPSLLCSNTITISYVRLCTRTGTIARILPSAPAPLPYSDHVNRHDQEHVRGHDQARDRRERC